ncbi:MAG: site-2 protease family protein [Phycisphaerales bacterium]
MPPTFPTTPPGNRGFWRRLFENPENPLGWSLKMFTARGITARVHLLTVVYLLGQLLWSIPQSHGGFLFVAPAMLALFLLVLAHEFGHCFACRYAGGSADRIVMLPWGGLALTQPPNDWRAHFVTTAGGPLVNVALAPAFALGLWACGLGHTVLFNPFNPISAISTISGGGDAAVLAKVTLFWFHAVNLILLGFNLLLPMYPFDGGRLIHALLWRSMGYRRATHIAVLVGFAGAMVLGVAALLLEKAMLVLIAVFGALSCYAELKRLRGEADLLGSEGGGGTVEADASDRPWDSTLRDETPEERAAARRAEHDRRQAEKAAAEQADLDRVLDKIAATGMDSLSRAEMKVLERETERKRKA